MFVNFWRQLITICTWFTFLSNKNLTFIEYRTVKTEFGHLPTRSVAKRLTNAEKASEYLKRQTIRFTLGARCLNAVVAEKLDRVASQIPDERIRARHSAYTLHRNSLGGIGASNFPFYFLIRCLTGAHSPPHRLPSFRASRALFISFRDLWAAS